jgi:hypothetical protein
MASNPRRVVVVIGRRFGADQAHIKRASGVAIQIAHDHADPHGEVTPLGIRDGPVDDLVSIGLGDANPLFESHGSAPRPEADLVFRLITAAIAREIGGRTLKFHLVSLHHTSHRAASHERPQLPLWMRDFAELGE